MPELVFEARGVCAGYGRGDIVSEVDVAVGSGQILTVIGRDAGSVTNKVTKSYNKMFASNLHLLTMFGPEFIDARRYQQRLDARLQLYYEYLGRSWFDLRLPGFWEFHAAGLHTCGLMLDKSRVRREALRFLRGNPEAAVRTVARNLRDGRV